MVPENYKPELLSIIARYAPQCKVYLFGSRATDQHSCYSDIDIALDNGQLIPANIFGNIRDAITSSNIIYFVDIVDLHAVSSIMKVDIEKTGVLWKK